jgi:hypothetical protein
MTNRRILIRVAEDCSIKIVIEFIILLTFVLETRLLQMDELLCRHIQYLSDLSNDVCLVHSCIHSCPCGRAEGDVDESTRR